MKRFTFLITVLVLLLLSVAGFAGELNITYNPMPFNLPSMIERDQGVLQSLGVSVSYHTFQAGFAMTEAMAAKELDIAVVMGGTSAITSIAGGRDIKILSAYSQAPSAFALVTREGQLRLSDLKGKTIGLPVGTEAHYLLGKILVEQNLTLSDVRIVNLMVPDAVTALQSGQIDGAVLVEPVLSRLVAGNQVEILRDGTGLISGLTVTAVRGDVDPRLLALFREAHVLSLQYILEHKEEALLLATQATNLPPAVIHGIFPKYNFDPTITEEVIQSLKDTARFLFEQNIIRREVAIEEYVVEL